MFQGNSQRRVAEHKTCMMPCTHCLFVPWILPHLVSLHICVFSSKRVRWRGFITGEGPCTQLGNAGIRRWLYIVSRHISMLTQRTEFQCISLRLWFPFAGVYLDNFGRQFKGKIYIYIYVRRSHTKGCISGSANTQISQDSWWGSSSMGLFCTKLSSENFLPKTRSGLPMRTSTRIMLENNLFLPRWSSIHHLYHFLSFLLSFFLVLPPLVDSFEECQQIPT